MNKFILITILFFCFCLTAHSQDTTSIATEKVEVIKNYEAIIQQAKKKNLSEQALEKKIIDIEYKYQINSEAQLDFDRPEEIIRPVSYNEEQARKEDIKDGSIYGAYGNLSSLNFGAAYHYYIEDWINAGFKFDHFSANDKELPHQKFNNNRGKLYTNYFLTKKSQLGARFEYMSSEHNTLDMSNPSPLANPQSLEQLGAAIQFNSTAFEKAGIAFRLKASYDQIKQKEDDSKEGRLNASANLFKTINDKIKLEIPAELIRMDFSVDSTNHTPLDIILQPQLRIHEESYNAKVGIEFIKADSSQFIFPIISVFLEDIYEGIDLHLFTSSRYNRNSMHYLTALNPYYRTDLTTLSVNYLRSYNLSISKEHQDFNFGLRLAYNDYTGDDLHFDRVDTNRAVVGDIDRTEWQINPSIRYSHEMASIELSYNYNIFSSDTKDILVYRPESELSLNLTENLFDSKLILSQSLNFNSSRRTVHPLDEDMMLEAFWDLSLGLEYKLNKSFTLFGRAMNVLGSEYELWYGHPVFQRQFLGGLRVNF